MYNMISSTMKPTYNWDLDKIPAVLLTVPALILALLVHPSLNNNFWTDSAWTFALYLESVALFP